MVIKIERGTIQQAMDVERLIPEFDKLTDLDEYIKRLSVSRSLIVIAKVNGEIVGFKVGHEDIDDGVFYSWIGAVKQEHRAKGIASLLLKFQEDWVLKSGFRKIRVTTYNKYKAMICMLVRNNYQLVKFDPHDEIMRGKLTFEKII